jgi:hypothetical protein
MSRKQYVNVSLEPEAVDAVRRLRAIVTGAAMTEVSLSQAVLVAERMIGAAKPSDVAANWRAVTQPEIAR